MPATAATVTPEQIWDLVNFVMSVPFESSSPKPAKVHSVAGQSHEIGNAN